MHNVFTDSISKMFALSKIKKLGHVLNTDIKYDDKYRCMSCGMIGEEHSDNVFDGEIFTLVCGSNNE